MGVDNVLNYTINCIIAHSSTQKENTEKNWRIKGNVYNRSVFPCTHCFDIVLYSKK